MTARKIASVVLLGAATGILGGWLFGRMRKAPEPPPAGLVLTSPAFQEGGKVPAEYTCDGANVSPPLNWSGVPRSAKSLAIICTDPDAPSGEWTHWLLWNLAAPATRVLKKLPTGARLASGASQGTNDFKSVGWGGPCPPSGSHRYVFTLYALDKKLDLPPGSNKDQLLQAIEGHALAQAKLTGNYSRGS